MMILSRRAAGAAPAARRGAARPALVPLAPLLRRAAPLPLPPRRAASGAAAAGAPGDDEPQKPEAAQQPAQQPAAQPAQPRAAGPLDSVDLIEHPQGFVARRLLVFAGILIAYTCL
jgi:hypothetical protein